MASVTQPADSSATASDASLSLVLETDPAECSKVDLLPLVLLRRDHQTDEAEKGVRAPGTLREGSKSAGISQRRELANKIHEIVRLDQERAATTGLNRTTVYSKGTLIEESVPAAAGGNAQNARMAAKAGAKQVSNTIVCLDRDSSCAEIFISQVVQARTKAFAHLLCGKTIATAGIDTSNLLQKGAYGIIFLDERIMLAQGRN